MNKQTAVEWLHDNLTKVWYDVKSSKDLLEQAKAIEKEQMCQFISDYIDDGQDMTAEQFYNETYNADTP